MPRLVGCFCCLVALGAALCATAAHAPTKDDFLVKGLEAIVPAFGDFDGDLYAGTISTDPPHNHDDDDDDDDDDKNNHHHHHQDEGGSFMFFFFDPRQPAISDSLVIWFNGGPGCSSVAGMLFENSPVTVPLRPAGFVGSKAHDPLLVNEYGWTKSTAIMYIEQPHGVGYSKGPEPQNEDDVARYFVNFLRNFYNAFGDEYRAKRLYLFGESYAGYYVPSMAHKIHQLNKQEKRKASQIPLHGIALGNGWVDAAVQGPMLVQYAWWHGLIDTTTKYALQEEWEKCRAAGGPSPAIMPEPLHPFTTPDDCGMVGAVVKAAGGGIFEQYYKYGPYDIPGVNIYDVTTWDGYAVLFDEHSTYSQFFNDPRVKEMIHAPADMYWEQCIPGAGRRRRRRRRLMLDHDQPESVMPYIAEMLDQAKIQVLIYNGDRDMSTCSQGNEVLLDEMDWSGAADWKDPHVTRRGLWVVQDKPAGYSKTLHNLNFVVVYNSGHLAPYNQPAVALDLVTRYLNGTSFADHDLPIFAPSKTYVEQRHYNPSSSDGSMRSDEELEDNKSGMNFSILSLILGILLGVVGTVLYNKYAGSTKHNYERV